MKEIALHILDIAENCIAAGADRVLISIFEEAGTSFRTIRIEDNGRGMSEEEMINASNPFYTLRTTRRVGLGLPLFRQHAEMTGGKLTIASEKGTGTVVSAIFDILHPDCQPLGDLEGTYILLSSSNPETEWELLCEAGNESFSISTSQIREELDVDMIRGSELTGALKRLIRNNLDALGIH